MASSSSMRRWYSSQLMSDIITDRGTTGSPSLSARLPGVLHRAVASNYSYANEQTSARFDVCPAGRPIESGADAQMPGSVNISDADIRLLKVFNAVVQCGGFAAAQVELNVGQSTISAHMATLESRLGVRLCERGRGGFRLTEQGRHIHEAAQRLFREVESFRADV